MSVMMAVFRKISSCMILIYHTFIMGMIMGYKFCGFVEGEN